MRKKALYMSLLSHLNENQILDNTEIEKCSEYINSPQASSIVKYALSIIYLQQNTITLKADYRHRDIRQIKKLLNNTCKYTKLVESPIELYSELAISSFKLFEYKSAVQFQNEHYKLSNTNESALNLLMHAINNDDIDLSKQIFKRINFLTFSFNTPNGNILVDVSERMLLRDIIDLYLRSDNNVLPLLTETLLNFKYDYSFITKHMLFAFIAKIQPDNSLITNLLNANNYPDIHDYIRTRKSRIVRTIPLPIFSESNFIYNANILGINNNHLNKQPNLQKLKQELG